MKIWSVHGDINNYMPLQFCSPSDNDKDFDFAGIRWGDKWTPLRTELVEEEPLILGDFATQEPIIGAFACNDTGLACLRPHIEQEVEILPLIVVNSVQGYSLINVLNVIDCLKVEESHIVYSIFSEKIIAIEEYAFAEEKLTDVMLFKLPQTVSKTVFATEAFYFLVQRCGLTGLEFRPLKRRE